MTYSIGFRSPSKGEVAREILERVADQATEEAGSAIYRDPAQTAVANSGAIPEAMMDFAQLAMKMALRDPLAVRRAMGEYLTEPKANVWFAGNDETAQGAVRLDRRTRMLYDDKHIFINGESFRAAGRDAQLMRALADDRCLKSTEVSRLSAPAAELLADWCRTGWMHVEP